MRVAEPLSRTFLSSLANTRVEKRKYAPRIDHTDAFPAIPSRLVRS